MSVSVTVVWRVRLSGSKETALLRLSLGMKRLLLGLRGVYGVGDFVRVRRRLSLGRRRGTGCWCSLTVSVRVSDGGLDLVCATVGSVVLSLWIVVRDCIRCCR